MVQAGESLSSISRKHFGTPNHYGKIAELNKLRSHDRIRVGQLLLLPDIEPAVAVEIEPQATPLPVEPEHGSNTAQTPFEPQPPTLNIVVPK